MYVGMYVCMHACMYVCMYVYIYNIYVCMYVCIYIYVYIYIYVWMYVCMYVCTYIRIYVYTYIYIYIYISMYMYTLYTYDTYWYTTSSQRDSQSKQLLCPSLVFLSWMCFCSRKKAEIPPVGFRQDGWINWNNGARTDQCSGNPSIWNQSTTRKKTSSLQVQAFQPSQANPKALKTLPGKDATTAPPSWKLMKIGWAADPKITLGYFRNQYCSFNLFRSPKIRSKRCWYSRRIVWWFSNQNQGSPILMWELNGTCQSVNFQELSTMTAFISWDGQPCLTTRVTRGHIQRKITVRSVSIVSKKTSRDHLPQAPRCDLSPQRLAYHLQSSNPTSLFQVSFVQLISDSLLWSESKFIDSHVCNVSRWN